MTLEPLVCFDSFSFSAQYFSGPNVIIILIFGLLSLLYIFY